MTAAQLGLTDNQLRNIRGMLAAVRRDQRFQADPKLAARITVETGMVESGCRILASANVPASLQYPHDLLSWTSDGLGHDHASCGMFQQQTGYAWCPNGYGSAMNQTTMNSPDGWGTPAELMNPEISTSKFLNALARVDWRGLTPWLAAQSVQHSGFPDGSNYAGQDGRAAAIVNALWDDFIPQRPKELDMPDIVRDAKTRATYILLPDAPVMRCHKAAAAKYAQLLGTEIRDVDHDALVSWDHRMRQHAGTKRPSRVGGKR